MQQLNWRPTDYMKNCPGIVILPKWHASICGCISRQPQNNSGECGELLVMHPGWKQFQEPILNKLRITREHLEKRTNEIRRLLHTISHSTYAQRKSSPLSLLLRNFRSEITKELKMYWYNDLNEKQLAKQIQHFKNRYSQRKNVTKLGYRDDKELIFKPAVDAECHGKPHPIGSEYKTFFCGRFRYGVSLFPGFHFDVSAEKASTIQCELRTPSGNRRSVRNRAYVNIFPNDYILPEK